MLSSTTSVVLFLLLPLLTSVPFAVWRKQVGGYLVASAWAATSATILYAAYVIVTVGYGPTGTSIAVAFSITVHFALCLVLVHAWPRLTVLRGD